MSGKRSVRNETKIKVMQAARELNYFPNAGARMLRGERTRLVALSSPMSDETAYGDWSPFFSGVARRLRHYGCDVLLLMGEDENEELVRMSDSGLVDGVPAVGCCYERPACPRGEDIPRFCQSHRLDALTIWMESMRWI